MYVMTVGALEDFAENIPAWTTAPSNCRWAVLFAVTGISRATTVVTDIQSGYFDRLVMTPVNRLALLIGLMVADFALVMALTVPVIVMGFIAGVQFETGILGILAFIGMAGVWGACVFRFSLCHRLQNGKRGGSEHQLPAVFPFLFMTSLFVPQEQMTGWLAAAADYNPVTYIWRRCGPSFTEAGTGRSWSTQSLP